MTFRDDEPTDKGRTSSYKCVARTRKTRDLHHQHSSSSVGRAHASVSSIRTSYIHLLYIHPFKLIAIEKSEKHYLQLLNENLQRAALFSILLGFF